MNEADTPNHGANVEPLESVNLPQPESGNCPFYLVAPDGNIAIPKVPLLAPAANEQCKTEPLPENLPQEDWVAEPDKEQQSAVNSEFQQLLTLNEELQVANKDLYNQVEELTTALAESEKALQMQRKRSTVAESMLNQQTQELTAAQEQIRSLYEQLETAVQTVQHQEISIENYKVQLEINQQRLAQLERECTLIQSNYQEQSHQLLQSENACRELRTRLMRQQRQTLQFKAALEKCLETPFPNDNSLDETPNNQSNTTKKRKSASSLLPNAQPIRPWSAEPESFVDSINLFTVESLTSPVPEQSDHPEPTQSFVSDTSDPEDSPTPKQPANTPEIIEEHPTSLEAVSTSEPFNSEPSNLEEQLNDVIQLFFTSSADISVSSQPLLQDTQSNESDEPIWETYALPFSDDQEPEDTTINLIEDKDEVTSDYWSKASPILPLEEPFTDNSKTTPSPVVYPQRPPKGRKSLASVELPNFHSTK